MKRRAALSQGITFKCATETFYYISLLALTRFPKAKGIASLDSLCLQWIVVVKKKNENEKDYMHFAVYAVIGILSEI